MQQDMPTDLVRERDLAPPITPWQPATYRRKRCAGGGPKYYKRGNRIYYSLSEVLRWFTEFSFDNTSQYSD